jgi:glycosyltransferase involved in cell wall biosynthesis
MPTAHVLYEYGADRRPHGSAYIRLLGPLTHPGAAARGFRWSWGLEYEPADVVIVERLWQPGMDMATAEELVERVRRDGCRLVYTLDDNLLDLKVEGAARKGFTADQLNVIRYFARESDGVIVSTEPLRERLAGLNRNVLVVPNAIDERRIAMTGRLGRPAGSAAARDRRDKRRVIGYMGTFTHDGDLMMVLRALREVLRDKPQGLEFQLVGAVSDPAVLAAFDGLPVRVLEVGPSSEYPAFVPWMAENLHWDLAIAPLEDNRFTRCKSDIKFLDYGWLGVPGVYSRVPAYEGSVRHLETGYLAGESPGESCDEWAEGLRRMLADDDLRRHVADAARDEVLSRRTLQQRAGDWPAALEAIVSGTGAETSTCFTPSPSGRGRG